MWGLSVLDGISSAEAGRRKEDAGFQTRGASEPNLANWRLGLLRKCSVWHTPFCEERDRTNKDLRFVSRKASAKRVWGVWGLGLSGVGVVLMLTTLGSPEAIFWAFFQACSSAGRHTHTLQLESESNKQTL